jgi:hypothetical protein
MRLLRRAEGPLRGTLGQLIENRKVRKTMAFGVCPAERTQPSFNQAAMVRALAGWVVSPGGKSRKTQFGMTAAVGRMSG